jgi:purine nucleoside permease
MAQCARSSRTWDLRPPSRPPSRPELTSWAVINASLSLSALLSSPIFNLQHSYFVIAGIAGINPKHGTIGSVVFARWAVQVDLQYEYDAREIPGDWESGFIGLGCSRGGEAPKTRYGTEAFELSAVLRARLMRFARDVEMGDSGAAAQVRARYAADPAFEAGTQAPRVQEGDSVSSNIFFHGHGIAEAHEKTTRLLTNDRATYVTCGQEDNGLLEALWRGSRNGSCDFARVVLLRAGSNFDREAVRGEIVKGPIAEAHGGFDIAVGNLWRVGHAVVAGIMSNWESEFEPGLQGNGGQ